MKVVRDGAQMPTKGSLKAAGWDAYICEECWLAPGDTAKIPLGWAVELPPGMELQIRPRSGWGTKGILVHFATIDEDYRGELFVTVTNTGRTPKILPEGARLGQMLLRRVEPIEWSVVEQLSETERGAGGHGSSGF